MGLNLASIIGTVTGKTAGGILDSITNTANSLFNTESDKEKVAQFNSQAQQLIQAELDKHNEAISAMAEQQFNDQLKDIQSARDMEVAVQQAKEGSWLSKNINPILAFFVSSVWGGVTVYLLLRIMNIIEVAKDVNMTSLMAFYTAITATETIIISFYFGSSNSSQKKDDVISKIAQS